MGLDITAYRRLSIVDASDADEDCYLKVYANPDFPGREAGLQDRALYTYAECDHVFGRSYGGYSCWRDDLAKMAGYPLGKYDSYGQTYESYAAGCWENPVGPFAELIHFADNEGVIGPVVAAKLLADFIEWDARASVITEDGFYDGYCDLRRGLEMAVDGGCLQFH